ncbi:unknown protein [Simkania negevensis Z]|uniref:Uncharacterized protein n=1 Tax=Simkania negevensis (strain ATCC VR-1471 / DSM 27360 / Z) TaxID=331113 RepID=F8L4P1_SIMNZ|nr:unknown protein [Simkania negevensis Z]
MLSEFFNLKLLNINNMIGLKTGKLQYFGTAEDPIFEVV